jgi:uncharacterized protein (TIGR02001 family)
MRAYSVGFLGAALCLAAPVSAQDAAAAPADTAPPSAFTVTGGATLISDYRFRGLSQTDKRFAVQGTLGVAHSSGFYVGTWGSSIDDYIANGSDQEVDLYAGYKKTVNGTTVDGGLLYYYYPGGGSANTDFFEPYLNATHTFGPVTAKVGGNFSWSQHGLYNGDPNKQRSAGAYGYAELSAAIPTTGVTVTGHLGHSFVRNYITFDSHYTDWSVTAAYSWKALTFSAAYVDTDKDFPSYPLRNGHNRDISKGGFVGAVAVAF